MKETLFAFQNKKTQAWLKIVWVPDSEDNVYNAAASASWKPEAEVYNTFHRDVLYSARNIIEEDFNKLNLKDRDDWQLITLEVQYTPYIIY